MSKTLLIAIATSLLGAGGCVATVDSGRRGPPPPPPAREHHREPPRAEPHVVEGTIRDAATGRPIDRAGIDITSPNWSGEITVNTGPDGRYRSPEIPRGPFGVRVRREGYQVIERRTSMGDGSAHLDFEMHKR